mgnify:CR=1 FL=1
MEFNLEVRAQNGKVYTNASDLLPAIQEGLKAYDYVVYENNYKQAKTDRASLNNLVKVVSDKRKQVENDVVTIAKKLLTRDGNIFIHIKMIIRKFIIRKFINI